MEDEPLFIEALDGPTRSVGDVQGEETATADWELEQSIARRYGDAGQPIDN